MRLSFMLRGGRAATMAKLHVFMRKCCCAVLYCEGFDKNAEVSVSLVSDSKIKGMNQSFRGLDEPTDVLSFPLGENGSYDINPDTGALLLGDIVLSLDTAARQAKAYGHSLEREVGFLTVHSMLHLLGYDHEGTEEQAAEMRKKEELVLEKLGIPRKT
ncbi:MAG: rRNA maturation RNase YbeY [Oscillospiraceae bacterium]|nr:rRNA maturation RNase YbeY [Oscillospiraceae bacterium]